MKKKGYLSICARLHPEKVWKGERPDPKLHFKQQFYKEYACSQ